MQILTIILLNFLFYWRTLKYEFISDDKAIQARTPEGGYPNPKNAWQRFYMQFRCRRYINSREVHLMNFVVHLINCVLIYVVFGMNDIAFLTAILFTINPINLQCVAWCSGRAYAISTTLVLCMFILPFMAPLFFYLTRFFSVNAIFAPLCFITTKYWYLALMVPVGLWLERKRLKEKSTTSVSVEMKTIGLRKVVTFIKTFGYYFMMCLFPVRLGWHHQFVWGIGVTKKYNDQCYSINKEFRYGLAIFYFVVINIFLNWSPFVWGLLWFSINIAMWCNFITWQQQIAERFCYLANVGMMYVLAGFLLTLPTPLNLLLIGIFIGGYAIKNWITTPAYKNEYWRIEQSIMDIPNSHYAWLYRGFKKFHAQDYVGALYDFQEARVHSTHEFKVNFNIASCFIMLQQIEEAKKYLKYAEDEMYIGEEPRLKPIVDNMWAFIKEIEETKQINVQKVVLFS